jgi:hypothetical protein
MKLLFIIYRRSEYFFKKIFYLKFYNFYKCLSNFNFIESKNEYNNNNITIIKKYKLNKIYNNQSIIYKLNDVAFMDDDGPIMF